VRQYNLDLKSVKEKIFAPLLQIEQNLAGLPTDMYDSLSLCLSPESTTILSKILGFFMVNPAITMIFFSPIIMVFVKALGFKRQLLFSFMVQPEYFKRLFNGFIKQQR